MGCPQSQPATSDLGIRKLENSAMKVEKLSDHANSQVASNDGGAGRMMVLLRSFSVVAIGGMFVALALVIKRATQTSRQTYRELSISLDVAGGHANEEFGMVKCDSFII